MINYHNKKFKPVSSSFNGEASEETIFHYQQTDNVLTASYRGGEIVEGHLVALVDEIGKIEMSYHHINSFGQLMTGICNVVPEILANGKIRLHATWQWTSGDFGKGTSVLEEL